MRDNVLRRELKRYVRLNCSMSFLDARSEVIRWAEEGEAFSARPRARSCAADVQVVGAEGRHAFSPKPTND